MTTLLFVEDEVVIALAAAMTLEDEGYDVVLAGDGEEGLARVRSDKPDLIITDYMMPRMDGVSMIAALRREGVTTPVVLATSIGKDMIPAGAEYDAFLRKPYLDQALIDTVRSLLTSVGK